MPHRRIFTQGRRPTPMPPSKDAIAIVVPAYIGPAAMHARITAEYIGQRLADQVDPQAPPAEPRGPQP